ncbi:uncharacterized protein si:ch211-196c10.15 [Centropristis striata]|uniref:uncharacterized protein si:ch211-196c10.15 n=1 Tax=Centropristis striata TaxID=184440 RepID=UPI0027DFBC62|nr:uncharacterized protein si:ch211-196c10.15 [Centropristis striata]
MEEGTVILLNEHKPLPSPDPKRLKKRDMKTREREREANVSNDSIYEAIQKVLQRFDTQDERLKSFELRIEANTQAVKENKEEIEKMQKQIASLKKENSNLTEMCKENARYKRRWDLRLLGLPEKDNEDVKEVVIGILTRVIPVAVDKIRELVDTVHRLGKKNDAAHNKMPRPIIIQFATRTARNDIWKKSKDARVCRELNIHFREDFSKEDREARGKLWPRVEEARRNGRKAFLKEGYAVIDGIRVEL